MNNEKKVVQTIVAFVVLMVFFSVGYGIFVYPPQPSTEAIYEWTPGLPANFGTVKDMTGF